MRALLGGILIVFGGVYAVLSLGSAIGSKTYGAAQAQIAPTVVWGIPSEMLVASLSVLALVAGLWLLHDPYCRLPWGRERRR